MAVKLVLSKANGVTKGLRTSYMYVHEKHQSSDASIKAKYMVDLLIPKKDKATIKLIRMKIEEAVAEGVTKPKVFNGVAPKVDSPKFYNPLKDGDERESKDGHEDLYADHYYLVASTEDKPQLFGLDGEESFDKSEFYSGCYVFASLNLSAFNVKSKGVGCYLNGLKKAGEGEPLGSGKADVAGDFDDEEDTKTKSKKVVAEEDNDDIDF